MRQRTPEELEALARQAAKRDLAALRESGVPVTSELVKAMARQAAMAQARADLAALEQEQPEAPARQRRWLGDLFTRIGWRARRTSQEKE
jgi:hypothetical protein